MEMSMSDPSSGPFWLAPRPTSGQPEGVDNLGLRQPGLSMANVLLPGLTNTTRIARYYSVIGSMYQQAESKRHLRVLEDAFVQAVRWHHRDDPSTRPTGVVGADSVEQPRDPGGRHPLSSSAKTVSALDAAFYGPSAVNLGIAGGTALGGLGRGPLAGSLAEAVQVTEHWPGPDQRTIGTDDLEALSKLCPCTTPTGRERAVLQEILFRLKRRRSGADGMLSRELRSDGPRRRTLAVVLDGLPHADQAGGLEAAEQYVGQLFLDWALGRAEDYEPAEELRPEAMGLAYSTLRWVFRHALETIWSGFGTLVYRGDVLQSSLGPVAQRVVESGDGSSAWFPKSGTTSMRGLVNRLGDEADLEWEGYQEIENERGANPLLAMLAASMQLARVAVTTRKLLSPRPERPEIDRYYEAFLGFGGVDRVSLRHFASMYDEAANPLKWVRMLLDRFAVGQHFLTAGRKWPRTDGFFFVPGDAGYEFTRGGGPWKPAGGPRKLAAALSLLRGIGLVEFEEDEEDEEDEEEDSVLVRSALGADVLDAVLRKPGARPGATG
jgi:hypothetical protein